MTPFRGSNRRVLFPYTSNVVGGSFVSSAILVREVGATDGWHATVCLPHPGPNTKRFQETGAQLEHLGVSAAWLERARKRRLRHQLGLHLHLHYLALAYLRSTRPDLIHVNDDATMLSWATAARRLGIPVVWHVRQEHKHVLDQLYGRLANKIILIAQSTRKRLPELFDEKATVIHNASDTQMFYPATDRARERKLLGLADKPTLGYVGRLRPSKRPEWAVQTGIDLLKQGLDLQIVIVGPDASDGYYDAELPDMVRRSGVNENAFHFLGLRQDVPALMRVFDILLLPSVSEPFGLVATEAMASGVAVVANDAGGVREVIRQRETGVLTAADNYEAFRAGVLGLLSDQQLLNNLSASGRAVVQEEFSPPRVWRQTLSVYQELVGA